MAKRILVMLLMVSFVMISVPMVASAEGSSWAENLVLKGDLRLRNEYISNKTLTSASVDNTRQRIRFRLGGKANINDELDVKFGIASGGTGMGSGTSTNQTLGSQFGSYTVVLDYAYAIYEPYDEVKLFGGKMKSPYLRTDMLWDTDLRWDGFAGKVSTDILEDLDTELYLTHGYFEIGNNSTTVKDPFLVATQVGATTKLEGDYKLDVAVAYYDFHHLEGLVTATGNNAAQPGGAFANELRVIVPTIKLSDPSVFDILDIPYGLFYEYADNAGASAEGKAWRAGFRLGQKKVREVNDWKFIYQWQRLEQDAFLDAFNDGDFMGTDTKGWEVIIDYMVAENVIISADYYNMERLNGSKAGREILQLDVILKF